MKEIDVVELISNGTTVETLESEIKKFADERTYWARFLAEKILSGHIISDDDIDVSYDYMLEELKLKKETEKPDIVINYNNNKLGYHKPELLFTILEDVEGVNALVEKQEIQFGPNITIIYGVNGAGKSGYVRLLKKAFYSKSSEEIIPNVYLENGHKPLNAKFTFKSDNAEVQLSYPADSTRGEFEQFSVFDGKSVIAHLDRKNEFEFRPAGLSFFSDFSEAISRVEKKNEAEISNRQSENNFAIWFDGDSTIKDIIVNLSSQTKLEDIRKYVPFTDEDKAKREGIDKRYDELLLASKGKEKEIKSLENIRNLLHENKQAIEQINKLFTVDHITAVKNSIADLIDKEIAVRDEGVENFKNDSIKEIGTEPWKSFILSAKRFADKQKEQEVIYPEAGDSCLFCHQPLSEDAKELIINYWIFIKSVAEENARKAQEHLDKLKSEFEKLKFEIFPEGNMLTAWLSEKHPDILALLREQLLLQRSLSETLIADIITKNVDSREALSVNTLYHDEIKVAIDCSIKVFAEDQQRIELNELLKEKTFYSHKEKLNTHLQKIEKYVLSQCWIKTASKANFGKRRITDAEKILSDKYFNQKYIDTFNEECRKLNGEFGIEISHTGSAGKSYRQLKLKGRNPNAVLSEGEQKVIAIADFLSEMRLSEINKGIIFDDPVTSLDDIRKAEIAEHLVKESSLKQVIIFTHDLVFVSALAESCERMEIVFDCHWVEKTDGKPGTIWLDNTPSFEKEYKKTGKAQSFYNEAQKLAPEKREQALKNGFAALRSSYESLVVFGLFNGVVQRFVERVSVDSLSKVSFTVGIRDEIIDGFHRCCSYMEGHLHSDKYAYKKPELQNLNEEINRFNAISKKIKETKPN